MLTVYREIRIRGVKKWIDPKGRCRQKTKIFSQTLNPFNTRADGQVKTSHEILSELKKERDQWISEAQP